MSLKAIYEKQDEIPEAFRELFSERNGKWELTGITGIKTQGDVDRALEGARKERELHAKTKDRLRGIVIGGKSVVEMNDDELSAALTEVDKLDEYKASAGKVDEAKIEQIVESRLRSKTAPIERERDGFRTQVGTLTEEINGYKSKEFRRGLRDLIIDAKTNSKFHDSALDDIQLNAEGSFTVDESGKYVTKDNVGVTPGVGVDVWLTEMQPKRSHWWPESQGGGARGGKHGNNVGNNPFTHEHWNMSEQGRIVQQQGVEKAEQMAKAAGTTVGGARPAPKS